jgi:heterodisulfide reductase subunit A2
VVYPDRYNQEISDNKAVHIYFAQAIPLITYIDESCLYLKEKKCRICEGACKNDAIDLHQIPEKIELKVGAIILSPGYDVFDPKVRDEYGYGRLQNVVTGMDYERLMCATGPYEGEILRASDMRHPHNVAWIQCVGSRRETEGDKSYCSSVCCTYAQKQVILTKDHDSNAACTIFHNDVRAYGKGFETFYQRTQQLPDVRFIRSYVSIVGEDPVTKNVIVRYATESEGVKEESFDMVVLSVGLNPPKDYQGLAKKFGIEVNGQGFCRIDSANPMATTRLGVFVSGAFQGPMDIPESVFTASGAGSQCGELLNYRRGKLTTERIYPPETNNTADEPRIGVFVCHCGANISRVVDVPDTVAYTQSLPNVVHVQQQLFSCATNSMKAIVDTVKEKSLNRVVIAACSPRTLEALFRDTLREAGINKYYLEMANIREHCSWCHAREKEAATVKAKDIVRMSVARSINLEPLQEFDLPVNRAALVVGGGLAGMICALSIADQGHDVHLLERETELGGIARRLHSTIDGKNVQADLAKLIGRVYRHPAIHVYNEAVITETTGYVGNFVTRITSERGPSVIEHGATVIAIGAEEYKPTEYLYGQDERVMTALELGERIARKDDTVTGAQSVVMIQCVGCRNEDHNYCSRVCCSHSVKNALKLKAINPEMDVAIAFRDLRTYGFNETYYREASDKGVRFIRWTPEDPPVVAAAEAGDGRPVLQMALTDPILGKKIAFDADLLVLAAAVIPSKSAQEIASQFKVPLGPDGFFQEGHVKLRPVEFATSGVFLCGMAHYPKHIPEATNQAYGAAGRALTLLSNDIVTVSGAVCEVNEKQCIGCGACIAVCSYDAIELRKTKQGQKAVVNPVICKGDGLCNAVCPTGAIVLKHFTDREIESQIDALLPEPIEVK